MAFLNKAGVERLWMHIISKIGEKVDIVEGKGLSTNDYTDEDKEMLTAHDEEIGHLNNRIDELSNGFDVSEQIEEAINAIDYPVRAVNGKTGDVTLTASDVGALPDTTEIPSIEGLATESYVNNQINSLVDSAPDALNTLNELSAALGDDPNFAATVLEQVGKKVDKVDGKELSTNDYTTAEKEKLANLANVAVTGNYNDLIDKPTIPEAVTDNHINELIDAKTNGIDTVLNNKVDKVDGKGLSTNDYTTTEKELLASLNTLVQDLKTRVETLESTLSANNYLVAD